MAVPEDIRARQKDEETVDLLSLLTDQVVDYAIYVIDPDGHIASWNAGAQRIKGYTAPEIVGKAYAIVFTEEDRVAGKPQQILSHARAHGRYQEEGWRVRKDGSRLWASVAVTALHDRRGVFRGFAKITRDLTERRQAEEMARLAAADQAARRQAEIDQRDTRRARDQLDLILRSIAEGVMVQTIEGGFVFVNDAAARLCGFDSSAALLSATREEIFGKFEILREDGSPFPLEELPGRLALFGGDASTAIVRFRMKGTGQERWAFVSGAPVLGAEGKVEC